MDKRVGIQDFIICSNCGAKYKIKDNRKGVFECMDAGWMIVGGDLFSDENDFSFLCPKCKSMFKKEVLDVGESIEF